MVETPSPAYYRRVVKGTQMAGYNFTEADLSGTAELNVDETIERALATFNEQVLSTPLTVTDFLTLRTFMQVIANKAYEQGMENGIEIP